jgi:hypothetical protein
MQTTGKTKRKKREFRIEAGRFQQVGNNWLQTRILQPVGWGTGQIDEFDLAGEGSM